MNKNEEGLIELVTQQTNELSDPSGQQHIKHYQSKHETRCEEDFILELGWILMITNSHHKEESLWRFKMRKQHEDKKSSLLIKLFVSLVFIFDLSFLIII
jgi:hypothetical protein